MNLTLSAAQSLLSSGFRPTRGRCMVHLDPPPAKVGSIHVPELSQELRIDNTAWTGTVLAMEPRRDWDIKRRYMRLKGTIGQEEFAPGDRVVLLLAAEDLSQEVIIARNERVMAEITE